MIMKSRPLMFFFALCAFTVTVQASEVEEAIQQGLSAYKSGDFSTAVSQLDYAATLIRQEKAGKITAVFPSALAGWEAEEAESNSAGGMMMGGGITANRTYRQGEKSVSIQLMMDSPMLQSMMMMFNNPSMIAMSGGKLIKIQGQQAMLKKESADSIQITMVVNSNALFTVQGYGASEQDVKAYAEKLNLSALN